MPEKLPPRRRRPMAAGSWVRSFHCKSTAAGDVAAAITALPKKPHHLLLPRSSCASSGDAHRNVSSSSAKAKPQSSSKQSSPAKKAKKHRLKAASVPPSPPPGPLGPVPALTELPAGHSSRQVVEIIFLSSWSPLPAAQHLPAALASAGVGGFTAEVEMLFRVHNPARAVARFEDYRAAVRARAGGASRSAADGNEMMRFSPAPPDGCSSAAGEDALRIRTFDGSGGAHANGRGPASGRRAMFLCRVIAGRVADGPAASDADADAEPVPSKEYDSVRAGKGELIVFDRRAVLPCFLIIYKL
ncbi:uncharacterized protein LOC102709818 [Oryza brachyantha]|uniref:uncharacterized protein LOC102709818 n=1 Tax=Oryza brachyantha TaxID=4533 RepID=UPI001ADCE2ED|nr:uncharacterized protein LOC102709818 [Oryza brachyantha]